MGGGDGKVEDTSMTYRGHIKNGVVVLDEPVELPEGLEVRIEPLEVNEASSLYEQFREVVGRAKHLPNDMAENHDHYLRGAAKRGGV